jgi:hypothetical protein
MGSANDGLRFSLELAALASLGYWGFAEHDGGVQWLLGLGMPLLAAVVWGVFVSPKASRPTTDPIRLLIELIVFGGGVAALWTADSHTLAFGFGVLVVLHVSFTFLLDQRPAQAS